MKERFYVTSKDYTIDGRIEAIREKGLVGEAVSVVDFKPDPKSGSNHVDYTIRGSTFKAYIWYHPEAHLLGKAGIKVTVDDTTREAEIHEAIRQFLDPK